MAGVCPHTFLFALSVCSASRTYNFLGAILEDSLENGHKTYSTKTDPHETFYNTNPQLLYLTVVICKEMILFYLFVKRLANCSGKTQNVRKGHLKSYHEAMQYMF